MWPKVCPGSVGRRLIRIHITSIGAPRLITSRPARLRTTECRPSAPTVSWARICSAPSGVFTCNSRYSAFLLDEIGHLRLHLQVECGITPGLLGDEVEEVPLWHESEETTVSREMPKIRNRDRILSHLTGELSYFLMRAFQELVQNTEFMHNFECGWMDRIPTEISQEIGVLFEHEYINAHTCKKKTQHHAGRTASSNAAASVNHLVHATDNHDD